DNVVALSKSYLATLEKDKSYDLVFNFSAGKAATFTLKVEDTTVQAPVTGTTLSVGTLSGKPGEKVVVPVKVSGLSSALGACQFNVNYDPSGLEVTDVEPGSKVSNPDLNFAYKNFSDSKYVKFSIANLSLKAGTNAVSGDGDVAYITFT
ncbi:cohesin domain-containing protein, partial [Micromonospora sp. BL1]|uniref:cohesin domain-containing protein n=1 Tax=Micromonospora sp. BL1 TaxID=2478709 RepID=UPI0018F54A98